ncbi:cytochrome P450 [Maritalea porphyrae]|jgi:cytochrome P450|uniref:cytochrome P450 n=1 Tax=Maritalea porphyrae TaxID=880732 RepID=UPI0022AE6E24|nr:cytochrome P450 [Maritalea porphyrae]MCZ4271788.1 cytochrome P450 [Maritalea porphyrae]
MTKAERKMIEGFDLTNPPLGFVEDPFPFYHALLKYAPVCPQPDGSFVLTRFADLDRIYRDTTLYISDKRQAFLPKFGGDAPLYEHHTTSLVFNDPPLHTRVRKIMVGALNARAIANMEPGLLETIDTLLEDMAGKQTVDLIEDFASKIPIQIIGNMFDMPMADREPLRDWSLAILGALEPTLTPEQLATGNKAVVDFKAYLKDLANHRRKYPGNPETDVLTRLIESEEGELSETELLQNCIFILNAGHETTTNLIGNALAALHAFPGQKYALKSNPEIIKTGVDEFLRFLSPNQLGNRETTADIEIDGIKIPTGSNLHLVIGAANRDPSQFEDPDELKLMRRPNRHLAFAGGPHLCVGFSLARMEGRIAINRFLKKFPNYQLTGNAELGGRLRFRGYAKLPAKLS